MPKASSTLDAILQAQNASLMAPASLGLDGSCAAKPCDLGERCDAEHHWAPYRDERSCLVRLNLNSDAPAPCELRWNCDAFHHWHDIETKWYCATSLISKPHNPSHYQNGDGTWSQYTVVRTF